MTSDSIKAALSLIKSKFSTAHNSLNTHLLKCLAPSILPFLLLIINSSLSTAFIPWQWRVATIIPIFKGKYNTSNVFDYRPISILCPIAHLTERIVYQLLIRHFESNSVLSSAQHGGRRALSTITIFTERPVYPCGIKFTLTSAKHSM
eukprot:GHVN01081486.1.p1 GENE.GHVN01081486.1~~GHVN01081486.1.p1  ORF type:complete len:148 (+),score=3.62 GHVN01081486.1:222-665(+)